MKTIKNNKFTLVALVLLTLGLYSCTDKFLDEEENYLIDSEGYFNSEDDYYMALVGAYDLLQATYVNNLLGEIASDNTLCGGESATDVVGFQQIDDMTHTPVNANLRDIWNWMFAGVKRTNYFLEFQNNIEFDGRVQMVAEVRFLRAYFHFELVKWFGGIPVKDYANALEGGGKRFSPGDETSIPRYSVEEVYALIESDLIFAANNLDYTTPQVGRVTKGAAQALLGKAYLYQDKFSDAATVLGNLIDNGPYQLVDDYSEIFENDGENGVESVFEVQYSDGEGAGFDCLQCSEGNVAVGFMGIRNHTGPTYDSGYSFNVPTQEAYDNFDNDDTRKDVSILDIVAWAEETEATYVEGYEHTGFYNRKYLPRKGDQNIGDQNLTNPNNYRAIRYADVLLMAAEANNRGNLDETKALAYLNQVRERAFGDSSHNSSATGAALTDAILDERRHELLGEGHRFFDLVRTGRAAQAIEGFVAGKHELFPIPFQEIQFSAGNWDQNPNY
ncbi:MAG: RagB/SusD family nutrient uptake outer membrane protein [Flavobacteriaceae bacterium]|jgi:starch-binding outer membrane protein, SusD/RagB family|nr:RagB/SusD family nutrient uptake outer membrane protein [Bacteroidota bacterium]